MFCTVVKRYGNKWKGLKGGAAGNKSIYILMISVQYPQNEVHMYRQNWKIEPQNQYKSLWQKQKLFTILYENCYLD